MCNSDQFVHICEKNADFLAQSVGSLGLLRRSRVTLNVWREKKDICILLKHVTVRPCPQNVAIDAIRLI